MNILKIGLSVTLFLFSTLIKAQEPKIEEKKVQEVVFIDAEPKTMAANADGSFPPADTAKAGPMNLAEILKRAVNYVEIESPKYIKGNSVSTSSKAECIATFVYKAKELNPQSDANGVFTMHISIDAKEGRYRYTISKINHVAKNPEFSGGDVYSEFPKCGSMRIPPELWKKLRSQALKNAALIIGDIKETMKIPSNKNIKGEEW